MYYNMIFRKMVEKKYETDRGGNIEEETERGRGRRRNIEEEAQRGRRNRNIAHIPKTMALVLNGMTKRGVTHNDIAIP